MRRNLGRVGISGVLITICIGPFKICIQKILDLGQEVFAIRGTLIRRRGYIYTYKYIDIVHTCKDVW